MMTKEGAVFSSTLSDRQSRMCVLVAEGWPNRKIAEDLQTTEQVIKNQFRFILQKCGMENRQELIIYLFRHRIVKCPCGREEAVGE